VKRVLRTLVLVENLSVPSDRRVWQECLSLGRAGFDVSVICPRGAARDREAFELRDGVEIRRYPARPAGGARASYAREYGAAAWHMRRLVRMLARRSRIDVVHACNPPDLLFLSALGPRRRGARFVFDHHDLAPELYLARFSRREDLLYRGLLACERLAFRLADVVLSANESYRQVALARGRKRPEDVFVVRTAPSASARAPGSPEPSLKRGRPHLLAYVGLIGPQDGVDLAVRALAELRRRRTDWHATIAGEGDALPATRRLAGELGLGELVDFPGWLDERGVAALLSTADVCLAPEPKNRFTDASSMAKLTEYMAFARPIVSFDLRESRLTAASSAVYAVPDDPERFAGCIDSLLDDPPRRAEMGEHGRRRAEGPLSWMESERSLLAAYDRALRRDGRVDAAAPA
jgi:glycosyltransferase involved in cell wall biosynthesis